MTGADDYQSIEAYVDDNREMLVRVLRHSSNAYARACAWALLDEAYSRPEIAQLRSELDRLEEAV